MKPSFAIFLLGCALALPAAAQREFFELAPISYSKTPAKDAMALLDADWKSGAKEKPTGTSLEKLRTVLRQLNVPEESQVLVYSKTSKQNELIHHANPRSVFYSDDVYVGYVPGGAIEVAATDPDLGPIFYLADIRNMHKPNWVRRDNSCLQCHGTSRTELVPGLLVRSVYPGPDSHPILAAGTFLTTQSSPLVERWGGWYVTGTHGDFRHMGNTIAEDTGDGEVVFDYEAGANWTSLEDKIDLAKYLQPTSDIVSLMVLEHQCQMHNLLTKASMEYRRLTHLQRAIDSEADLEDPEGMAARSVVDSSHEIVREMLFCNEVDLGDGVEGSDAFGERFEAGGVETSDGRSLRQLKLYGRLFEYRCSYMIHSPSFDALPPAVRRQVLTTLWKALNGDDEEFSHLGTSERTRIIAIVRETVKDLPACWMEAGK